MKGAKIMKKCKRQDMTFVFTFVRFVIFVVDPALVFAGEKSLFRFHDMLDLLLRRYE
jgi:hypothetical protein